MFKFPEDLLEVVRRVYCGGRPLECDGADGADCAGELELDPDPDDELLPEFDEELEDDEFDEDELEPDDEPDDDEPDEPEFEELEVPPDEPEPLPELDDDDPELWSELW